MPPDQPQTPSPMTGPTLSAPPQQDTPVASNPVATQQAPPIIPPATPGEQYVAPQPQAAMAATPAVAPPMSRHKHVSLILSLCSFAVLVAGFFFGFAALVGATLGIYGARRGRIARYKPGFIIGITGAALNLAYFFVAVLILHYQ